jgi:hypothetical protein
VSPGIKSLWVADGGPAVGTLGSKRGKTETLSRVFVLPLSLRRWSAWLFLRKKKCGLDRRLYKVLGFFGFVWVLSTSGLPFE